MFDCEVDTLNSRTYCVSGYDLLQVFNMASREGPRAAGTDGSDFQHRERVALHYQMRLVSYVAYTVQRYSRSLRFLWLFI